MAPVDMDMELLAFCLVSTQEWKGNWQCIPKRSYVAKIRWSETGVQAHLGTGKMQASVGSEASLAVAVSEKAIGGGGES